ncbi:MAG: hypothetical protein J6U98_01815 [Abditibacteriota bacterium]|nr:hypothetical protein [Abditibacteriota bacterium]
MASLKCSNCGYGIHYHDLPDGTEHYAFRLDEWNRLINTDLSTSKYLCDGTREFLTVWKCRECGTLHTFSAFTPHFLGAYKPYVGEDIPLDKTGEKYIIVDDITWEDITEQSLTGPECLAKYPPKAFRYTSVSENGIVVYDDRDFTHPIQRYITIE